MLQILAGQNREHARRRRGCRGIDFADARVRMRRAQHNGVCLARQRQIVDIIAMPGQKTPILDPAHRLADPELVHSNDLRHRAYRPHGQFCHSAAARFCAPRREQSSAVGHCERGAPCAAEDRRRKGIPCGIVRVGGNCRSGLPPRLGLPHNDAAEAGTLNARPCYSTVTLLARFLGWSTSVPLMTAVW